MDDAKKKRPFEFSISATGDLVITFSEARDISVEKLGNQTIHVKASTVEYPYSHCAAFSEATCIGDQIKDGTIYAGVIPSTGHHMFVPAPELIRPRAPTKAMDFIANGNAHGHKDWRLANSEEYELLFKNRRVRMLKNVLGSYRYFLIFNETGRTFAFCRYGLRKYILPAKAFVPVRFKKTFS